MKRYEAYMPTGTKWMPNIPASWGCKKIGELFSQRKEKVSDKDYPPISVTKNGILPQLETAVKTDDGDNRKLVLAGDFVINSRSDRKGSCGVSSLDGSVSLINIVLQPRNELSGQYAHYLLRSQPFSEEYYRNGRGIVADLWTTRYSEMKSIMLPVPPRIEQDQIVRYLDWQVSKINRLIAAKKREIHLLKEHKQTQIADLVLGRNYPKDKLKRSGVMGFDAIPAHWTILPQKRVFKERVEHSTTGAETLLSVSRHYGVKPANALSEDEQFATIKPAQSLVGYKVVRKNDLAMNIMRAQNGSYGFSEYDGIISPAYCVYELIPGNDPVYMHYLLKTPQMISVFFAASSGITDHRRRLYPDDFLRVKITLPPIEEQQRIVAQIELIETSSKGKVEMVQQQIDCLTELRTRLISDVVTGQIDVRDIEIPDYEYTTDTDSDSDADEESDISDDSEEA